MSTGSSISTSTTGSGARRNNLVLPGAITGLILFALLLVWLFRGAEQLQTAYGRRTGPEQRASVNGTYVLSEMFRQSGRNVTSVDRLSPRLQKYQTVVWFPDDFGVPTDEQLEYLETEWMAKKDGRTVIYVGRDYDAATAYWQRILPLAPPEQLPEVQRHLADAKSRYATERASVPKAKETRWFTLCDGTPQKVTTLAGPWATGVDASKAEITIASRLDPPKKDDAETGSPEKSPGNVETLLSTGKDVLISRATNADYSWHDGKVIVVANGSTLLNYPLINKEHRKIAAKLIAECPEGGDVAFVESGRGGPPVEHKSLPKPHQTWPFPMNAIVFHMVMLALIYCLARAPIFGRPQVLPTDVPTDFGKHITALGKLMQRTKDQAYAYARLQQYRQHGKRDSGKTHKK